MYCDFGCGQNFTNILKNGKHCCSIHPSSCPELRRKNSLGTGRSYAIGVRKSAKERYSALPDETKRRMNWNKENYSKTTFEYGGIGNHKKALLQERGHACEDCGLTVWKTEKIPLELDHIDGDSRNNIRSNLKLLCCNCHALTPTWRGKNINTGVIKVSDDNLIKALVETKNIRQALQKVGLTPKGGNYARANKLKNALMVKSANTADLIN